MEQQKKIKKLSKAELEELAVKSWPIWEKEVSNFDWFYDSEEQCLILEGEVEVKTAQETVSIRPGDFVTFKKGLSCKWDVKKPVRKHYRFL